MGEKLLWKVTTARIYNKIYNIAVQLQSSHKRDLLHLEPGGTLHSWVMGSIVKGTWPSLSMSDPWGTKHCPAC